jgi:hypothetical protein
VYCEISEVGTGRVPITRDNTLADESRGRLAPRGENSSAMLDFKEDEHMSAHLRVFTSNCEEDAADAGTANVHVRLGDLLPLLAVAQRRNYLWLSDFLDDEVAITEDLYEVLRGFNSYRPSA